MTENNEHSDIKASAPHPRDAFEACHKVLSLPELCGLILDELDLDQILDCAEAGGPFLNVIKGIPKLAQEFCLECISSPDIEYRHNNHLFPMEDWHHYVTFPDIFSLPGRWANGGSLPSMVFDYAGTHRSPTKISVAGYNAITKALQSGDLFLQMMPSKKPERITLIINDDIRRNAPGSVSRGVFRSPTWKTVELLIDSCDMQTLFRIAKRLYEWAADMNREVRKGEQEEWEITSGRVAGLRWQERFSMRELQLILDDRPRANGSHERPLEHLREPCGPFLGLGGLEE